MRRQRRALALSDDGRLKGFFLGSPRQLPETQAQRRPNCQHCGKGDEIEPVDCSHGIIGAMKYIAILAFVAILGSLGSALFFMMRGNSGNQRKSNNMFRALAMRVAFSILLFVCILVAWKLGIIQPTGIKPGQ